MNAPIFPLSNVVFFPETFLPLHVFEPRYRRMVDEVLEAERMIAMVLAREERPPGAPPAIHRLGSVGRVEVAEPLEGGRWRIVLKGIARVELGDLRETPGGFFTADLRVLGEALPDMQDPRVADAKARFLLTARRYGEQVLAGEYGENYFNDVVPYRTLVNRAASILRVGVEEKQRLLTVDDLGERARRVEERMDDQIEGQLATERFERRRPPDPRLN